MFFDRLPDVGMTKTSRREDEPSWYVDLSIQTMTASDARKVAADLLNTADMVDELNRKLRQDNPATK